MRSFADFLLKNIKGGKVDNGQSRQIANLVIVSYRSVGSSPTASARSNQNKMEKENKILYSAVILDDESKDKLLSTFGHKIPEGWKKVAHHMTIAFGEGLPEPLKEFKGKEVTLNVTDLGISDMAMAVKVNGFYSKNDTPHITIAFNEKGGGSTKM